eukprot:1160010-Pelagomonas_calceolata.AAC.5
MGLKNWSFQRKARLYRIEEGTPDGTFLMAHFPDSLPAEDKRAGGNEVPEGHPEALHGKTFVISGVPDSLFRETATDLIKKHSGKVTQGHTSAVTAASLTAQQKSHSGRGQEGKHRGKVTQMGVTGVQQSLIQRMSMVGPYQEGV